MAQMVSIMGPPPLAFTQRSQRSKLFWDEEGKRIRPGQDQRLDPMLTFSSGKWVGKIPIPENSLEATEQRLRGKEKRQFLAFMRKMLQWRPEDRADVRGVFMDEWLLADLIEAGEVVRE